MKKLTILLLVGAMCLLGATAALAYNEAPMLRTLVAAGELPPVEERLPEEPYVVKPIEEIGQYGGTMYVLAIDPGMGNDLQGHLGSTLFRIPRSGIGVGANMAKRLEVSEDKESMEIYLRKGLKWSDGHPFTAEDIEFMIEDMGKNLEVTTWWGGYDELEKVEVIDDYTIRISQIGGLGTKPLEMAKWVSGQTCGYMPKHYLKKWHIKYNPKADELAKEEGYDRWYDCMYSHYWWAPQKELNLPTTGPWILTKSTTTNKVFERNPYYWAVDEAGNQLPYIDRVVVSFVDPEVYQLKLTAGEADIAYMHTTFPNYPLYKEGEGEGDYRVMLHPGIYSSDATLVFNILHEDPALRKIFEDIRFRQAMSLAINRGEINDTLYFGVVAPRQATVFPSCSFYEEGWEEYFIQYDPDEANRLLDEMGLSKRDKGGFRIGPDGKALLLIIEYGDEKITSVLELVKEYWEDVGVKVLPKLEAISLFEMRTGASEHQVAAWINGPHAAERNAFSCFWVWEPHAHPYAMGWKTWLVAKEKQARKEIGEEKELPINWRRIETHEEELLPGEEPPEEVVVWYEWASEWKDTTMGTEEYRELGQKIFGFLSEKLWIIGTVSMAPSPWIAKNNLRNVPSPGYVVGLEALQMMRTYCAQLFFKQ